MRPGPGPFVNFVEVRYQRLSFDMSINRPQHLFRRTASSQCHILATMHQSVMGTVAIECLVR